MEKALSPEHEAVADSMALTFVGWFDRLIENRDQTPASPQRMAQLRRKRQLTREEAYELWSNESGFRPYLVEPHAMKLTEAKDQ